MERQEGKVQRLLDMMLGDDIRTSEATKKYLVIEEAKLVELRGKLTASRVSDSRKAPPDINVDVLIEDLSC